MRTLIIAISTALALGISSSVMAHNNVTHYTSNNSGGLVQGASVQAGSISGATTTGTGFAGTYGISNMNAQTSGKLRTGSSIGLVKGTSLVAGHSESGTLVEGAGAAGSIAGGSADAGFGGAASFSEGSHQHSCYHSRCSRPFNRQTTQFGEAGAAGGANGASWAATGSIGDGEGLSVQGFEAYGNAKAKADIDYEGRGEYSINTDVQTSSGAVAYTIEEGNAIGETYSVGWGIAGADAWRVHGDVDDD